MIVIQLCSLIQRSSADIYSQMVIILFYLHLAFMIRAFLILYPIIPDTEATVAPTAFLHIKKKQLKLREAKKKQHTVTEKNQ